AILPLIESIFHYTSDIKLLELSDPNHPLLSQLALKAPGTYHHSMMVGHLAEKAAEAVGGNSLLCRVASYYHDIGKLKKPEYFIENQMDAVNRHDSLSPSMSSLIISSHVKEGADLARDHRIVPKIIDIIREHHGTHLMVYFYNKAKQQENTSIEAVNENGFRYTGPRPATKESAIILLADSVEAASRTLTDPTHSRLKGLVKMIIEEKIVDGQLDNSHLSFNDIHLISESFLRVLPGFFHSRIEYPKTERAKGENGYPDSKSSKESETKFGENRKKDPKDIRSIRA
ncbi:MAG: HDIG domain-containing metalloprotein, partial [Nitrospinota bacterium]